MSGLEDLGVTQAEIDAALKSDEIHDARVNLAEQAADYWRSVSPEDSGEYVDSIEVQDEGERVAIAATSEIANIIEFGTVDTPEWAPRAKTEAKFRNPQ